MSKKWSKAPKLALYAGEGNGQGRTYRDPTDGDSLWPSVTTVLKHEDKSDLVQWAATKVAEKARDRPDIVMGDPDLVVQRLQYAHNDFRDERAEVGTGVHAKVQADYEDSWDYPELNDEQEAMMRQFGRFMVDYKVEILMCEFTVRGDGYMGTGDLLIVVTDPFSGVTKRLLTDLKTSKNLWETHNMQLAALGKGRYVLREVPEGTEGAFKRKGRVKAEDSWWVREPMPEFDGLAKLHVREDFYDLVEVPAEEVDLHYGKFMMYLGVAELESKLKEVRKS